MFDIEEKRCYYYSIKGATDDGSPDMVLINNRYLAVAVIFASWNHAFHACNQDYKKSHTVKSLR